jgi:hypothetical protein
MQFLPQRRFVTSMPQLHEMNLKKEQALLAREYAQHFYSITKRGTLRKTDEVRDESDPLPQRDGVYAPTEAHRKLDQLSLVREPSLD